MVAIAAFSSVQASAVVRPVLIYVEAHWNCSPASLPFVLGALIIACSGTDNAMTLKDARECPECGHIFKGNGWDGIDAHWRSKHEHIMPYEDAWPLLKSGTYEAG